MTARAAIVAVEHVNVAAPMAAVLARLAADGYAVDRIQNPPAGTSIGPLVPHVGVLLVSTNLPLPEVELAALPALRGVVFIASGTNSIDFDAATRRGIIVAHSPVDENAESMAEATIMLMLATLYRLNRSQQLLRDGWARPAEPYAHMLKGKTIGLIGFGAIARGVARRLAAWGAEILYTARNDAHDPDALYVSLDALLAHSDVVSLHIPLTSETRDLLDARRILAMKAGAILINTSRGGIVNEAALAQALASGRLSGAAIDTFASEPIEAANPLLGVPEIILTPHIAGHSIEANDALVAAATENVKALADGHAPRFVRTR